MSNSTASSSSGGAGLLQVAFIVLKLTGVIDWSWWWVLSPTWIPVGIILAILLVWGVIAGIAALIDKAKS